MLSKPSRVPEPASRPTSTTGMSGPPTSLQLVISPVARPLICSRVRSSTGVLAVHNDGDAVKCERGGGQAACGLIVLQRTAGKADVQRSLGRAGNARAGARGVVGDVHAAVFRHERLNERADNFFNRGGTARGHLAGQRAGGRLAGSRRAGRARGFAGGSGPGWMSRCRRMRRGSAS